MAKLKTMLLGISLALPLAALGAAGTTTTTASVAAPSKPEAAPTSQYECCWIFHMGRWYCIAYC